VRVDVADPNPSRRPSWDTQSTSAADTLYISNCKLCPAGVYKGQAKTWGNGIDAPIGWSHAGCVDLAGGVVRA
jgi:hypothetical protein